GPAIDPQTSLGAGTIDVGAITVDPVDPRIIYVGTGEGNYSSSSRYGSGVLKSVDGGNTFQLLSSGPSVPTVDNGLPQFYRLSINNIIVDPRIDPMNPTIRVLYASVTADGNYDASSAGNGIFKSSNGGTTWTKITGLIAPGNIQIGSTVYP